LNCGRDFPLSKAILFNGLGKFPREAEVMRQQLLTELKERTEELKKRKLSVEGAEQKAIYVSIGKIVEKIVPAYRDFNFPLSDCRPLFEPIDMLVFNGVSNHAVDSITFLEIKTGKAQLSKREKSIKEAVERGEVTYKEA
jgi:predicted Holliday junction resolvase-like endonuclease